MGKIKSKRGASLIKAEVETSKEPRDPENIVHQKNLLNLAEQKIIQTNSFITFICGLWISMSRSRVNKTEGKKGWHKKETV